MPSFDIESDIRGITTRRVCRFVRPSVNNVKGVIMLQLNPRLEYEIETQTYKGQKTGKKRVFSYFVFCSLHVHVSISYLFRVKLQRGKHPPARLYSNRSFHYGVMVCRESNVASHSNRPYTLY